MEIGEIENGILLCASVMFVYNENAYAYEF